MKPLAWLALALLPLSLACSAPVASYQCEITPDDAKVEPAAVWRCNRDVMQRVVRGERFSLREFRGAAEFFEQLTGIPADTRETSLGLQPGLAIRDNLAEWDAWYEIHGHALTWDAERGTLRVATDGAG